MKRARLAVLGVAIVAGGGAAIMMSGGDPPPPVVVQAPAPKLDTVDVLVAAVDLPMGQTLKPSDLRWQPWPANMTPNGAVKRSDAPGALEETAGSGPLGEAGGLVPPPRPGGGGADPARTAHQGGRQRLHVRDPAVRHAR